MQCDMTTNCPHPVTHIGEKGFLYCKTCAPRRQGWERTRALRPWELALLRKGEPVPSYTPISKSEHLRRLAREQQRQQSDLAASFEAMCRQAAEPSLNPSATRSASWP